MNQPHPPTGPAIPMPLRNVTVDARDPRALAEFYRRLTGWEYTPGHETPDPEGDDWLTLESPGDGPTRLAFQRSDATVPPWPGGARVHVDLRVPDLDAAHEHALACGATALTGTPEEEGHPGDPFRVYADPEGHPFCLCAPLL
ncbi:VOC family protein [Cellulosimicrobium sp. NPDC057127]|uniref:VOC family protein n=1 Tax=Cellulosimicrobium sp. NPDC057127 TaxID=3346026 RepID=UPI00362953F1